MIFKIFGNYTEFFFNLSGKALFREKQITESHFI